MTEIPDTGPARTVPDRAVELPGEHGNGLVYLREICERLWPSPAVVTMGNAGSGWPRHGAGRRPDAAATRREFYLIPGKHRPPLLVPASPRLAAAAVRHSLPPRSPSARAASKALAMVLATGLGGTMIRNRIRVHEPPEADTIEAYLRSVLATDIRLSMYLGPPRANRKPVLQLLSPDGTAAGYAKIGINPLTCDLVSAEYSALTRLGRTQLTQLRVPPVLHHDQWRGQEVLVMSTLPVWLRKARPTPERLTAAMLEVARIDGLRTGPLAASGYASQLTARLAETRQSPERALLLKALGTLLTQTGDTQLTFGAWHGDWSPWNMASTDSGLLVWDWERFAAGVPLGFDALHHWLQTEVGPRRREPREVAAECPQRAPQLLSGLGCTAGQARLTAVLYLAELATRYMADRQDLAGARLGATGRWLVPVVAAEAARADEAARS